MRAVRQKRTVKRKLGGKRTQICLGKRKEKNRPGSGKSIKHPSSKDRSLQKPITPVDSGRAWSSEANSASVSGPRFDRKETIAPDSISSRINLWPLERILQTLLENFWGYVIRTPTLLIRPRAARKANTKCHHCGVLYEALKLDKAINV